jgi:hypothetical protein
MVLLGVGANSKNFKVRQLVNVDGEPIEKNNPVIVHQFLQDSAGVKFSVPLTLYDLAVYQTLGIDGLYALSTDTSRAITMKDRGKQTLVGYGWVRL